MRPEARLVPVDGARPVLELHEDETAGGALVAGVRSAGGHEVNPAHDPVAVGKQEGVLDIADQVLAVGVGVVDAGHLLLRASLQLRPATVPDVGVHGILSRRELMHVVEDVLGRAKASVVQQPRVAEREVETSLVIVGRLPPGLGGCPPDALAHVVRPLNVLRVEICAVLGSVPTSLVDLHEVAAAVVHVDVTVANLEIEVRLALLSAPVVFPVASHRVQHGMQHPLRIHQVPHHRRGEAASREGSDLCLCRDSRHDMAPVSNTGSVERHRLGARLA